MSFSIDQGKYFTQSYISQIQPVTSDPLSKNEGVAGSNSETVEAAPPPSSSPQLLSDNDLRLLMLRSVDKEGVEGYESILDQYFSDPMNSEDPVAFLENLSNEGIELLKQAQSLPPSASIDINSMNKEEALNFILPQSGKVDLNNDGLVAGANNSKMFMFPPPNAPQSVKDAWADAKQNMSEEDLFLMSGKFMAMFITTNMHVDQNGKVTVVEPGDPNWRNVFAGDDFSYQEAIDKFRAGNEFSKSKNTPEMYDKVKSLLDQLDSSFASHGVA